MEITKEDWENSKTANERLIKTNKIQIAMAEEMLKFCEKKIAEFPPELN
jgi:hypothetical protein